MIIYIFLLPLIAKVGYEIMGYRIKKILILDFNKISNINLIQKKIKIIYYIISRQKEYQKIYLNYNYLDK